MREHDDGLHWTAGRRRKEAQAEIASLLELYPDFPKKARQESRIWFLNDRDTEQFLDGLRKAGLEIPPE